MYLYINNPHFVAQVINYLSDTCLNYLDRTFQARTAVREGSVFNINIWNGFASLNSRIAIEHCSVSKTFSTGFKQSIFFCVEADTFIKCFLRRIAPTAASFIAICKTPRRSVIPIPKCQL